MTDAVAFIGDVHGHRLALDCILRELLNRDVSNAVLLGDYVNKGPDSRGVLDRLVSWNDNSLRLHPLLGNHDAVLLNALTAGDVRPLLKMAGAVTIRSYLNRPIRPDTAQHLREVFPPSHQRLLKSLPREFRGRGFEASHEPLEYSDGFLVSGHINVGRVPRISPVSAQIDTGCGSGGVLTAFLWPSTGFFQCTEDGLMI